MKYRFEIIYQPKFMKQASDFMRACDLDMGEVGIQETMTFTSEKNPDVSVVKAALIQAIESCECKVLKIEGGKVE